MSLTQHLNGPLTRGFDVAGLAGLAEEVTAATADTRVVRPPRDMPRADLATVGGIVGQLIADAVEPAPPYPALLGAVRCGGLPPVAASRTAATYPSHHDIPAGHGAFAAWLRPTPAGWWLLGTPPADDTVIAEPIVQAVLDRHQAAARSFTPAQIAPSAADIADQYVLALLEGVYRGGPVDELQRLAKSGSPAVAANIAEDVQRTTAAAQHPLQRVCTLASAAKPGGRLGYVAPTLVPQWAEGDIAVGPDRRDDGFTLIDVKTSMRAHRSEQVQQWVAQLAAYALLDATDQWRIRRVGLFLPRQGLLIGWQLDQLLNRVGMSTPRRQRSWISEAGRAALSDGVSPNELDELDLS